MLFLCYHCVLGTCQILPLIRIKALFRLREHVVKIMLVGSKKLVIKQPTKKKKWSGTKQKTKVQF